MKAHTLMQTIARANRVSEGKANGLVVDYIGIVKALRQALADYTANPEGGNGGNDPTVDKEQLINKVLETISAAKDFLKEHDFMLEDLIQAEKFEKLMLLKKAANAMCENAETHKTYLTYSTTLLKLWKYLNREDITQVMRQQKEAIIEIYKELQKKRKHADITDLSVAINTIINDHLEIDTASPVGETSRRFDISGIDFELLRREFAKSHEKNLVLKDIQELLKERIAQMLATNPSRINFYEKYQEIIKDYNLEQNRATIEKTFEELMKLSNELSEEEKRFIREGFENDEQLSMYDLLMRNDLSKDDIKKIKKVAVELLDKIKQQLAGMDHPFDKDETKATIIITIRDILWQELPESYGYDHTAYRDAVYTYVKDHYNYVA
jgi:type I restriction enzyme R subunit